MFLSKKAALSTAVVISLSLLAISAYANMPPRSDEASLGIEIALKKPFYIPASTNGSGMSAVVRTPLAEENSEHETVSAVKLVPVVEGDKVKVTVFALVGEVGSVKTCKDWDSLKATQVATYVAVLDEEISITKLLDYGVKFENGPLKFRIVPKRALPRQLGSLRPSCGCASCDNLECCPNSGYCLGCGECGYACCNQS